MKAKDFLCQVEKLDNIIKNKLIEIDQWKAIAMNVTSGGNTVLINGVPHQADKVQSSGNPQKMADAVNMYVDIEAEINRCIDKLVDIKKDVTSVIEMLNTEQYDLLHKVYIQHLPLPDAAEACGKSYSWATTIHGRALKNVQKIIDERNKNNG
jgi:hypothetical protein